MSQTVSRNAFPRSDNPPVKAHNVVAASEPLASKAGVEMFRRGGNAVDAAIAAAAALMVVEPVSSGLGADAFALVWHRSRLHALNGSGRSPLGATADAAGGRSAELGWPSVTIPGAVSAWAALSAAFGCLPFRDLLQPAIELARGGFAVTPKIARVWRGLLAMYLKYPEVVNQFYPSGRGPEAGALIQFPHLQVRYRGVTLYEMPPNSQGVAALIALGILEHFDLARYPIDSAASVHLQIEAMKLAFVDTYECVADPAAMRIDVEELLAPERLRRLAGRISLAEARFPEQAPTPPCGGTTYLATADAEGMMVSYIQSSGPGFGSGIVVPDTGIALQSRGSAFSRDPHHPNRHAPGKRPFHTNCPALVSADGEGLMSFGLMGWGMQPQAHVQFLVRAIDHGQDPHTVLNAPCWRIAADEPAIVLEPEWDEHLATALAALGHRIVKTEKLLTASTPFGSHLMFGGANMICRTEGGYVAACDPRREGAPAGL